MKNIDDSYHNNPLMLVESVTNERNSRNLRGSGALAWEIINGLTARTEISISRSSGTSKYYDDGYNDAAEKRATLTRSTGTGLRWLNTLNYNLSLNKIHTFNFLLGHELIKNNSESSQLAGYGYPDNFDYETAIGMINTATLILCHQYHRCSHTYCIIFRAYQLHLVRSLSLYAHYAC